MKTLIAIILVLALAAIYIYSSKESKPKITVII